jgi:hypothetical protein
MTKGLMDKILNQESLELKVCTIGLTEKDRNTMYINR